MNDKPRNDETSSELAKAIAGRKRNAHTFDVASYFGFADQRPLEVAIRVPTKGELDRALIGAHAYVQETAGTNTRAKDDPEIVQDAKSAYLAFEFCRDAKDPGRPAFPSARFMIDYLAPEEIAVLSNLANEVRAKEAPSPVEISDQAVEGYVELCKNADVEIPAAKLAGCSREYLTFLVISISLKLVEERARRALDLAARDEPGSSSDEAAAPSEGGAL